MLKNGLFFLLFFFCQGYLLASTSLLTEFIPIDTSHTKEYPPPNPGALLPQWWQYFNVKGDKIKERVETTYHELQKYFLALSIEDQGKAQPLINKIMVSLNALSVLEEEHPPAVSSHPFFKAYTLDQQLELRQKIRHVKGDIKNEENKAALLKERLAKANKTIDNMMVSYLRETAATAKKFLEGLEIMAFRANLAIGENNVKQNEKYHQELLQKLARLEEEISYSKDHLDIHDFNAKQLEETIAFYQKESEKRQYEVSNAEAELIGILKDPSNHAAHQFLEVKVLQALVNQSYTWVQLSFQIFKSNVLYQLNDKFLSNGNDLKKNLDHWKEKLAVVHQKTLEWQRSALKEQERLRQEYAFLLAQNADSNEIKMNQKLSAATGSVLNTLEMIEEELPRTQWLIEVLEDHFTRNSTFLQSMWFKVTSFLGNTANALAGVLNYSLFKISDVPITILTLAKVLVILSVSLFLSLSLRNYLVSFGKTRGDITESTLYTLGTLAHYFVLLLGVIIALCTVGLDFGNLVFIAGALTLGITFALQSFANNFFSGLRILFERKLKIGDNIELLSGYAGKVSEIHIQNTVVRTNDGQQVIIPNSELVSNTLVNWTRHKHDYRRLHIPFSVEAGSDKELVRQVVVESTKKVPCALKHTAEHGEPEVWLVDMCSHSLDFKLVVWVDYKAKTFTSSKEADFLWEIETALRENKIALPSKTFSLSDFSTHTTHTSLSHAAPKHHPSSSHHSPSSH